MMMMMIMIMMLIDDDDDDENNNVNTKGTETKQAQRPGNRDQQYVESEDKNCASSNWSIRNN